MLYVKGIASVENECPDRAARQAYATDLVDRLILGPCDDRFGQYLLEFFCRLPENAFDFFARAPGLRVAQPAMNSFVTFNSGQGDPEIPLRTIVLFISNLCEYGRNDVLYTIAHEFAHVYLGHKPLYCRTHKRIIERDADTLVVTWGFEQELRGAQWSYLFGRNTS